MIEVHDIHSLRRQRASFSGAVALVPTMGNLHEGHLTLVRRARELAAHVVVSIFVNPLQFDRADDLKAYPRTLERDRELLRAEKVDLLFTPKVQAIYPDDMSRHTKVEVPGLSDVFCGASRPGHFVGVATIVCKLFNIVQPQLAVFGNKDYQQLLIIRRMVEDLAIPVELHGVDTVREADGLAMSSRNNYLTPQQREQAATLYQSLQMVKMELLRGRRDFTQLEQDAMAVLRQGGMEPDYFAIRQASDLQPATADARRLVILAAAFLGQARLIDNLRVDL